MSNAARQKRTAEASSRYANSKKPRFDYRNPSTLAPDAPEEDAILDLDEIGRSGLKTKRNAVNLDGFDSDSSAEDPTTKRNTGANGNGAASKDEEEIDMFAEADEDLPAGGAGDGDFDEDLDREGKKKGKAVRFLEMDQIQGQDLRSKSGGHVSSELLQGSSKGKSGATTDELDSSSEEEVDDESRAALDGLEVDNAEDALEIGAGSKKRHAPKLDAFNMAAEADEGRFDESGNFVRKATDPDAVHDAWMEGVSKRDVRRAAEASEKRDAERKRATAEDDALLTSDLLRELIGYLEPGETALEALQRLGGGAKRKKQKAVPRWKQKKAAAGNGDEQMDVDQEHQPQEDAAEKSRRLAVEAITGVADRLFSRDQQEIYEQERELLMRQYRRETGEDWKGGGASGVQHADDSNTADRQWEYRWSDGRDGGVVNGPYDGPTMAAWKEAGYFDAGPEYRVVGGTEWTSAANFA